MTNTYTFRVDQDMRNILIKSITQLISVLATEITNGNTDEEIVTQHENLLIMYKTLLYTTPDNVETDD